MKAAYLKSVIRQFKQYKLLGEKTFLQLNEEQLFCQYNAESNSIAILVKHLRGNMISRWTDLFTSDGEKEWRNRDSEFENDIRSREQLLQVWEEGWKCLFDVLQQLKEEDLESIVYIRKEPHTVMEAINRQLTHYPYHIGQIVYIGKMVLDENWTSLSIPKGQSEKFNAEKLNKK